MNINFIAKVAFGLAGAVTAAIGVGAGKAYADSRKWGLDQAREHRTAENAKVFSERDRAFVDASVIFTREDKEYNAGEKALKQAYDRKSREVNAVLSSERNAVTMHEFDMRTQHSLADTKCRNILAAEESRLEDMLKHDGEYKAYKETRKIRKEAGKSLDKIESKMSRRRGEIKAAIEEQRSPDEKKIFQDRDYYAREMADTTDFANSLVQQRTAEDKAKFAELKRLSDELGNRRGRRDAIISKRTVAEQKIVDRYNKLKADARSIELLEASSLDRIKAFAGYLLSKGWKPGEILVIGLIPLATISSLFIYLGYQYASKLMLLVSAMKLG